MMVRLEPSPHVKQADDDWSRSLPKQWKLRRLKTVCTMASGMAITANSIEPEGDYPVYGGNGLRGYTSGYTHDGSFVLIGRQGALSGNVHLADGRFWASEHAVVVTPRSGHHPSWLGATLGALNLNQHSISAAQPGLAVERILNLWLPVPSSADQTTIVRFLNYIDCRIQQYIDSKEKLIALLGEYKQGLVHQAVTGQIDVKTGQPYTEYKESGVEWLRKIPANWSIRRNGRLFAERNEKKFGRLPILEVSLHTGVRIRDMDGGLRKQQIADRDEYKRAARGDIAYNMMRMWQGAVGVAPVDGLISPAYVVAMPLRGVDARYFEFQFRTADYRQQINMASRGIVPDRNRLYWDRFKGMSSVVPPPEDQKRISDFLQVQGDMTAKAVLHQEQLVRLVKEHRNALIGNVVTGKLDVRAAAATLPEIDSMACKETGSAA